jgi:hypothetical protein
MDVENNERVFDETPKQDRKGVVLDGKEIDMFNNKGTGIKNNNTNYCESIEREKSVCSSSKQDLIYGM